MRAVPAFVAALSQTTTDDDEAWIDPTVTDADSDLDEQQLVEPTTFMFERSTAVAAIGAIATHLGTHFMPFVTETVAVLKQVFAEEYNEDVKVQAIDCVDSTHLMRRGLEGGRVGGPEGGRAGGSKGGRWGGRNGEWV